MKTLTSIRLIAITLMLASTIVTQADYTSLTVRETSGTWTSFGLKGLKVTFSDDNITVANNEMTQVYPISSLYSLLLTDLPTAISNATTQQPASIIYTPSGRVYLNAEPGTIAKVYNSYGLLCTTLRISQDGTPSSLGNLPPGIYIIKAGKESRKFLVK